jgi:hypothetical protein
MTIFRKALLPSVLAATLAVGALAAAPALAQGRHVYKRTVIIHRYTFKPALTGRQREAQQLHRDAVRLDHQATIADQHGNRKLGESLAHQASQDNARAYRLAHH